MNNVDFRVLSPQMMELTNTLYQNRQIDLECKNKLMKHFKNAIGGSREDVSDLVKELTTVKNNVGAPFRTMVYQMLNSI